MNVARLILLALFGIGGMEAKASITAGVELRKNGNILGTREINEGDSISLQYEYRIDVVGTTNRFRTGPIFPPDGTVTFGGETLTTHNVQNNARSASGGGSFNFTSRDDGTFRATHFGEVELERGFDDYVGAFPFNVLSTSAILVRNVAPTLVQTFNTIEVPINQQFSLRARATDPGLDDLLRFDWDYTGDGLPDRTTTRADRESVVDALFSPNPGRFLVQVSVTDGDGGRDDGVFDVVVYDPSSNGDFDGDGDVDGKDFLVWQRGRSSAPLSDWDLSQWKARFGTEPGAQLLTFHVPEPMGGCLLAMAIVAFQKAVAPQLR